MAHHPFVLLLSGPSGSGKSTTAIAWADARSETTAVIDMDNLRGFVRAGRARPEERWDAEAERQWQLAMDQCGLLARSYIDAGITCVIDVYAPPSVESDRWDAVLAGLDVRKVYLNPSWDTCTQRNAQRESQLDEAAIRHNFETHEWCVENRCPDNVIVNTDLTVAETIDAIDGLLGE